MSSTLIASIASFLGNVLAYITKKLSLNNSDDMKANAAAQTVQKIKDDATHTVSDGDIDEVRKGVAE